MAGAPLVDGLDIAIERVVEEVQVYEELTQLDGKQILELGCGRAQHTRMIAEAGSGRHVLALEVDETQHALNLQIDDLSNVEFALAGAEQIPSDSDRFDVVFMFKSLHHVPVANMAQSMREIARVLRPGGLAYVSEPLFRGAFNDVLRLFHDESVVRREAFSAIQCAVREGLFESVSQTFFCAPVAFADFAEFEELVIRATHSNHVLSDATYANVRATFERHVRPDGARFEQPIRVDLLRAT